MTAISKYKSIFVTRQDNSFDRACDTAYNLAANQFSEDGRRIFDIDFERSTDALVVKFGTLTIRGGMSGIETMYEFIAYIDRTDDDEEIGIDETA